MTDLDRQMEGLIINSKDLEARVKYLKSDKYVNGIKADAIEEFARDCNETSLKLSMSAMEYCDKLRSK